MLTQRDYPRSRLVRLLDALDAEQWQPETGVWTTILPPGASLPAEQLPSLLDAADGAQLATFVERSDTGSVLFASEGSVVAVRPPFPVGQSPREAGYRTEILRQNLAQPYRLAAVLLRFGGYAVGVFEDGRLVSAKNDSRFVKNRHRKGGQSQRRFDRIRDKQVHELFEHLCADALEMLRPQLGRLDWLAYGGDAHTVLAFEKECPALGQIGLARFPRFLTVPEPRHETLVRLPELITSSAVLTCRVGSKATGGSVERERV